MGRSGGRGRSSRSCGGSRSNPKSSDNLVKNAATIHGLHSIDDFMERSLKKASSCNSMANLFEWCESELGHGHHGCDYFRDLLAQHCRGKTKSKIGE